MLLGDNTLENALVDKVKPFLPPTKCSLENEPTTLKKECLRVIRSDLQHFQPKITNPELLQEIISSEDPSDLPCHGASFIDHEGFYKKASIDKFGNEVNCLNGLECHGLSYKRLYLERHFAGIMASPKSDIYEMIEAAQDYIFALELRHFSNSQLLEPLSKLPNLMALELQFGNKNSFDAPSQVQVFGSTQASDVISLAGALQSMPNLCCLSLTNSLMNDDLIRVFINELKAKETDEDSCSIRDTLVELNLSYNKLTTEGFRLVLLYFFDGDNRHAVNDYHSSNDHDQDQDHERTSASILSTLKVAGNKIRAEGARTLGRILKYNTSLENLDLRMNLLNDEGGKLVMNGLHQNQTLKRLNLSCNSLSSMTSDSLCAIFETSNCRPNGIASLSCSDPPQGNVLEHIDISSNDFKSSDIINLAHAVEQTYTLLSLDLRENRADTETSKTSIVHKVTKTEALESIHDKLKSNASRSAGPQSVPQSEMQ